MQSKIDEDEVLIEAADENGEVTEERIVRALRKRGAARPSEQARRIIEERLGTPTPGDGSYLEG